MYKNFLCTGISGRVSNVILRRTLHVIFGCLSNVIFNHLSNVIFKHLSNVILGFIPRIHAKQPLSRHYRTCPDNDSFEKKKWQKPRVEALKRSEIECLGFTERERETFAELIFHLSFLF